MSQVQSNVSDVIEAPRRGRRPGSAVRQAAERAVAKAKDFSHHSPKELLNQYWDFCKSPLAAVAAMIVGSVGLANAVTNVSGDLAELVQTAGGLQKAYGRNITRSVVENDLGIDIPADYSPTFGLYLSAVKLRPDTDNERDLSRQIKRAIGAKMREVRSVISTPKITFRKADGDEDEGEARGSPKSKAA
jgi:hypothetical protein